MIWKDQNVIGGEYFLQFNITKRQKHYFFHLKIVQGAYFLDCEQYLHFFALKSLRRYVRSWSRHLGLYGERNLGRGQNYSGYGGQGTGRCLPLPPHTQRSFVHSPDFTYQIRGGVAQGSAGTPCYRTALLLMSGHFALIFAGWRWCSEVFCSQPFPPLGRYIVSNIYFHWLSVWWCLVVATHRVVMDTLCTWLQLRDSTINLTGTFPKLIYWRWV